MLEISKFSQMATTAYERLFRRICQHKRDNQCHGLAWEIYMLGRVSESLDFKECLLPQDGAELRRDNLQVLQEITAKFEEHE